MEIIHLSDYIKYIEQFTEGYYHSHSFLFRGESRTDYSLIPALYRTTTNRGITYKTYMKKDNKRNIIHQFVSEAMSYTDFISAEDIFRWVQYAQHFGVPTRLLDWTANPLVALYFACCSNPHANGKIYILHPDFYAQITNKNDKNNMMDKILKDEVYKTIWEKKKTFSYPVIFKPYYFDKRMSAQSSWFMVWGEKKTTLDKIIEELEIDGKGSSHFRKRDSNGVTIVTTKEDTALSTIVIPSENKNTILHELNRVNINKATLFPGLDGIGASVEWNNNTSNLDMSEII